MPRSVGRKSEPSPSRYTIENLVMSLATQRQLQPSEKLLWNEGHLYLRCVGIGFQVPRRIEGRVEFFRREAVAKVVEAVGGRVIVDILPILAAEALEHMEEMYSASRVESGDGPINLATLKPR